MAWLTHFKDVYSPLMAGSIDGTDEYPHDHAITRAINSTHKPNASAIAGNPACTLCVARLSHATREETLREAFRKYGDLVRCKIVRDVVTGHSKCYAFVEFERERDAAVAWNECNGALVDDWPILVEYEHGRVLKGWVPRRLGGGLGGKKESGQLRFGGRDRPFRKPIYLQENFVAAGARMLPGRESKRDQGDSRDSDRFERDGRERRRDNRERERPRDRRDKRSRSRDAERRASYKDRQKHDQRP